MFSRKKDILLAHLSKGIWQDALPSQQPDGTYREAWGAVRESDLENSYGLSNELANELCVELDGEVRGIVFVEERDQYVVFLYKNGVGELGIIDHRKCTYRFITNSPKLEMTPEEWIDADVKVLQPCNELYLYFSTKDTYKYVNLDDPCEKYEIEELLKQDCIPVFDFAIHKNGGRLPNGTYWFFARLRDNDGNNTNWFKISKAVHISGGDHKQGEASKKAIHLKLQGLSQNYNLIELGVVTQTAGILSCEHFETLSYGRDRIDYLYRGKTGRENSVSITEVRARNTRYMKGKNLMQYDGRLVLYNLRSEYNLDYQAQADKIDTFYDVWVVPSQYAEDYKGLRPNENYLFTIQWNYVDGTSSENYIIHGRNATPSDLSVIPDPCNPDCQLPNWRLQDTSQRTKLYAKKDVFDVNGQYNDQSVIIDSGFSLEPDDYIDRDLTDEERDTVNSDEIIIPTKDDILKELNAAENEFKAGLDCLCERIESGGPPPFGCDPCGPAFTDLIGLLTLVQLQCMCAARTISDSPSPPPANIPLASSLHTESPDANNACAGGNCGGGNCGAGGCSGCGGGGCGGGATTCGSSTCVGCGSKILNELKETYVTSATGRFGERIIRYTKNRITAALNEFQNDVDARVVCTTCGSATCSNAGCGTCHAGCQVIVTDSKCCVEGLLSCVDNVCYRCSDGKWEHLNGINTYEYVKKHSRISASQNNASPYSLATPPPPGGDPKEKSPVPFDFKFDYIYDTDGCTIIGVKPKKYATGKFGYWHTEELYPYTENCDCGYIYGPNAGSNVRLHKVPSISKEPCFVSFSGGVPNQFDSGNIEDKESFVFFISPRFTNIIPPKNPPKPICTINPFSINYAERTEANKSVIGSGMAISCFKGEIQGDPYMFPKHGCNSWERFDRSIEPTGPSTFRGGTAVSRVTSYDRTPANVSPYIIHSADFHFRKPPLDASHCLFELEVYGRGYRHGLGAKGERAEVMWRDVQNQKGTRQSLLLNHYRRVLGSNRGGYVRKCVNAMSEAPSDSVVFAGQEFKYPLCNLWRESSIYTEMAGPVLPFVEGDKQGMGTYYGGADNDGDNASDRSFTGDTLWHQMPIHDVRAHLVSFVRYLPYQYGSPISNTYIPFGLEGTEENLKTGSIEGVMGDSYVGYLSFRRTSYISDKTNRKITTQQFRAGLLIKTAIFNQFFGNILLFIFRSLGLRNGGHIPNSGDASSYINMFGGLRRHGSFVGDNNVQHPGEFTDGFLPPPFTPDTATLPINGSDRNAGDNYFYHLLKSNVWTWMNSDINPAYRELGEPEAMEIYWPKLKGKKLDSSYPDGYDWKKTYLNRFFVRWVENASIKLIFSALFILIFVYGVGIWMIVEGIQGIITGFQAVGGGDYTLQTVGGILAAGIGAILVLLGVGWIWHWITSDDDNKLAESLVRMKNMRPDVKNPVEVNRRNYATYSFNNSRIEQFEDNFWGYNPDNNQYNVHEFSYGMSDPYNTCICPEERSVKVPYSNKQNIESQIDAWRNFKVNNYVDIPPDNGKISKIFKLGNRVYVHTTDMLLDLQTGNRTVSLDSGTLLLGSGDLFGSPLPIFGGVVEGYAGLKDPNAAIVSNWGYIFPDREGRELFLFTGDSPKSISNEGLRGFMQNNMNFQLLEAYPDFPHVDNKYKNGIGYSIGVDHRLNRLMFTKIDYKPKNGITFKNGGFYNGDAQIALGDSDHFDNASFTRSYYPVTKEWISRHFYIPALYAWDRFDMFTFDKKGMWKHNIPNKFNNIYDKHTPFVVDVVVNEPKLGTTFDYDGTVVDAEIHIWNGSQYIKNSKITFDKLVAFNSHQSTGEMPLLLDEKEDVVKRSIERLDRIRINYEHRLWVFNGLRDHIINPEEPLFDTEYGNSIPRVNASNIADYVTSEILSDNHIIYRFIFDSREDVKFFLKKIMTKVDLNLITGSDK